MLKHTPTHALLLPLTHYNISDYEHKHVKRDLVFEPIRCKDLIHDSISGLVFPLHELCSGLS